MIALILSIDSEEDRVSFQQMYLDTVRLFVNVARSILGNIDDAEDVAYEVYEKLAKDYTKYRKLPLVQMKRLGVTMVKNQCINRLRRSKYMEIPVDDHDISDEVYVDPDADVLEDIIKMENIEELKASIRKLKEEDQIILHLRYAAELSYKEIAARIYRTDEYVKNRLYRIRIKLKEMMI